MANIGYKPTINDKNKKLSMEVHIFNFNENIYGEGINIEFIKKIREEQQFASLKELSYQLQQDKEIINRIFTCGAKKQNV